MREIFDKDWECDVIDAPNKKVLMLVSKDSVVCTKAREALAEAEELLSPTVNVMVSVATDERNFEMFGIIEDNKIKQFPVYLAYDETGKLVKLGSGIKTAKQILDFLN